MRIISLKALKTFWEKHPEAKEVLTDWFVKTKRLEASNFVDLRKTFPTADLVGHCYVFNVGGNNYRVITRIHFNRQIIYIRSVLTHKEYDKYKWKTDC